MEREHKKKQRALTLEENKQLIENIEAKMTLLKEEKHQHFNTLKKVAFINLRAILEPFLIFQKLKYNCITLSHSF